VATPLSADRFLSALKHAGLGVVEQGKWRTHNRNRYGNWGPVNGVMIHHTGPYSSEADMVELCRVGYHDLPGPLCHGVIDRSGTIHLVGYGRTNHAGMGDTDVLLSVIAEKTSLPRDNEADTDGNRHFYGFECINTGHQAWPSAQLDAMARAAAAVCRAHGWPGRSCRRSPNWRSSTIPRPRSRRCASATTSASACMSRTPSTTDGIASPAGPYAPAKARPQNA